MKFTSQKKTTPNKCKCLLDVQILCPINLEGEMYQMCLCKFFQIYQCGEKKAEHQSGEINERNPLGENSLIKPSGTEEEKTPGFPTQNAVILHFIV